MPELDKYAPYILAAYGIAVGLIVGLAVWSILRLSAAKKKLDRLERQNQGVSGREGDAP